MKFNDIKNFVISHKILSVVVAVVLVATCVTIPVYVNTKHNDRKTGDGTSGQIVQQDNTSSENVSVESTPVESTVDIEQSDTTDKTASQQTPPASVEQPKTTVKTPAKAPTSTKKQNSTQTSSVNDTGKTNNDPPPISSSETIDPKSGYVQDANPETGISWDGKSPIIYTYEDGTTGTEKRDRARYEVYPGKYYTYYDLSKIPTHEYTGICEYCGRKYGDGTNGTCIRWWCGGDHVCPSCGAVIPENTCHTCNK